MSISIGIPVYNEESNITLLLDDIGDQTIFENVDSIYVYDDFSTDRTADILKRYIKKNNYVSKKVILISGTDNQGKGFGLNQIFFRSNADILITIDSDIRFYNSETLYELSQGYNDTKLGATSGRGFQNYGSGIYRNLSAFSTKLISNLGVYKPYYLAWGGLMSFSKAVYKQITIPNNMHRIDGYLYLKVIELGYVFSYKSNSLALDNKDFKAMTFKNYAKIHNRSNTYSDIFKKQFMSAFLKNETHIGLNIKIKSFLKTFLHKPISGSQYVLMKFAVILYLKTYKQNVNVRWRSQ